MRDTATTSPALSWPAYTSTGGRGPTGDEAADAQHAVAMEVMEGALQHLDELLALAAVFGLFAPAVGEARAWRAKAGKVLQVSGLTAEGYEAACGRTAQREQHQPPAGAVHSSGLSAEGHEAAAPITKFSAAKQAATDAEPGAAAYGSLFNRLGRKPA